MTAIYSPLEHEPYYLDQWDTTPAPAPTGDKKYILEMFPYPSGQLHMGHVRNYTIGDVVARFHRMNGHEVLYPMGFDSFGLPAENAAIQHQVNPLEWTETNISHMKTQLKRLGCSYQWESELSTSRRDYYHWNQWLFQTLYKAGLIDRKKGTVNWDPVDQTVLANEQVIDGKGWRSGAPVEKKTIKQWYLRITDYAEELLAGLETLDQWPERVKNMQRQWIGKTTGTLVSFELASQTGQSLGSLDVFTTRPDTLYGATYLAIAPEHDQLAHWLPHTTSPETCMSYIQESLTKDPVARGDTNKEKSGVHTGIMAHHPLTNESIPLFIADYVLTDYGTGAVMAVPAHDDRDHAFATTYHLPIRPVIYPLDAHHDFDTSAYTGDGQLMQSGAFNGTNNRDAASAITEHLTTLGKGHASTQYKLRDWLISRQRYWGTPIPIMYDDQGKAHLVPDDQLPVELPQDVSFTEGGNPIASSASFASVSIDGDTFQRETDTMDTFFDSSWYFLRYCDPNNHRQPFDSSCANAWLPVDYYIGGIEHACLHLLYARFFTKALRDLGLHAIDEPFQQLICQGMVLKDGVKMSKSLGNTVDPSDIISTFGADTARIFILFGAPVEKDLEWSDDGTDGAFRFLKRYYQYTVGYKDHPVSDIDALQSACHKAIKKITDDIQAFQFNTAISQLMILTNTVAKIGTNHATATTMAQLMAPFAPFMAESIWHALGHTGSVHHQSWPSYDPKQIVDNTVTLVVQVNGKLRDRLVVSRGLDQATLTQHALEKDKVKKHVNKANIVKTIVVPDRLINFVVN